MNQLVLLFVVALAASSLALTDEQKKLAAEHKKKCIEESGVAVEDLANVKKGIFADKVELNKFAYCFLKASGLIDDEGKPNVDVIKAKLTADLGEATIDKVLAACANVPGDTKEQRAAGFYKCYYNNSDKHVIT